MTGTPRHCPKGPSCSPTSRRGQAEGGGSRPLCCTRLYPCSQGWPPHPSEVNGQHCREEAEQLHNWLGNLCRLLLGGSLGSSGHHQPLSSSQRCPCKFWEVQGMQPLPGGTCEWRNGPWRESSADLQAPDRWGAPVGIWGPEAVGARAMAAGSPRLGPIGPKLVLNLSKSTCSLCDLCPPGLEVSFKNRGHQSPCLAEWVPRKVRESRAVWAKLPQCLPTPPRKSTALKDPPSSAALSLPPPCP